MEPSLRVKGRRVNNFDQVRSGRVTVQKFRPGSIFGTSSGVGTNIRDKVALSVGHLISKPYCCVSCNEYNYVFSVFSPC